MRLTAKQKGAMLLVAQGLQDKEIAAALGVTTYAASNLVKVGKEKLGIPCYKYSRAQLAMLLRDMFGGKTIGDENLSDADGRRNRLDDRSEAA